jgi:hypothetical protein
MVEFVLQLDQTSPVTSMAGRLPLDIHGGVTP